MNAPLASPAVPLLRDRDVAKALQCSPGTVWALVRRGQLPAVRLNGMTRFRPSDVDRLIATGTPDAEVHNA